MQEIEDRSGSLASECVWGT